MPEWTMREGGMPDIERRIAITPELRDTGLGTKGPRRPLSSMNPLYGGGAAAVIAPSAYEEFSRGRNN
jgi:hypothetical protein